MASEYLKWKYRDVQREEQAELSPAEKRKNWWHYHKWHVVIGVALAGITGMWYIVFLSQLLIYEQLNEDIHIEESFS